MLRELRAVAMVALVTTTLTACIGVGSREARRKAYVGNAVWMAAGALSVAGASSIGTCHSVDDTFAPDNTCGLLQNEGHALFLGTGVLLIGGALLGMFATVQNAEQAATAAPAPPLSATHAPAVRAEVPR